MYAAKLNASNRIYVFSFSGGDTPEFPLNVVAHYWGLRLNSFQGPKISTYATGKYQLTVVKYALKDSLKIANVS